MQHPARPGARQEPVRRLRCEEISGTRTIAEPPASRTCATAQVDLGLPRPGDPMKQKRRAVSLSPGAS
jgi:hypothetical protein